MKNRATPVLIALFFAGLVGLWWLDHARVPDRDARRLAEPRVLPELWEARPDDVQRVEIDGGSETLVFERRKGNRWQMTRPLDVAADPSLVENLAFGLKMLERVKDAGTRDLDAASVGLAPPRRTIKLYGPSGTEPIAGLEVGEVAPKSNQRYVRPLGSRAIDVIDNGRIAAVDRMDADAWRDRMLVRVATPDVRSLRAERPDARPMRLERRDDHWNLVEPFACVADEGKVDGLVAEVAGLRVPKGGFVEDNARDLAKYGLDHPSATITVTPRGKDPLAQTIYLGKPAAPAHEAPSQAKGARYYARRDDQDDVVMVDAGILKDIGVRPVDLHAKKVSDVEPEKADAVRFTSEGVAVVAVRREKGWERVAPLKDRADAAAIEDLLKRVATAEASVLFEEPAAPDPQLKEPLATLEIWQGSGPKPGEGPASAPEGKPALKLKVGRRDRIAKSVYVQAEGDPVVMALPLAFAEGWTFGGLALRDRQVAAISPPSLARLTIRQGSKEVVVEAPPDANPNRWRMTAPAEGPADPETVGRALFGLANLRAETLVTDKAESDAKYGLDHPALTIAWKARDEPAPPPRRVVEGEEVTLAIGSVVAGKPDQPRYARISTSPVVFTLPSTFVALFEAEWRDRNVLAIDPKATERITFRWPDLTLTARPIAGDWKFEEVPPNLKMDKHQLDPVVKALAHLTTFRYAQYSGPIPPVMALFPAKLTVEIHPSGLARPRTLRLGGTSRDGYVFATTEETPEGVVFLLPLSNWAPWIKPPMTEEEAKKAGLAK